MRFTAASSTTASAMPSASSRVSPDSAAGFNTAWGATEPAPLDDGRSPAPFAPAPVHGWAVTMPAVLDNPPRRKQAQTLSSASPAAWGATMPLALEGSIEAQPFREAMQGLAIREVDEPALFRLFFGSASPSEWSLEPKR